MTSLTYLQKFVRNISLAEVRACNRRAALWGSAGKTLSARMITPLTKRYHYTQELKSVSAQCAAINKVMYDSKIHVLKNALGLHTALSRAFGATASSRQGEFHDAPSVFRNAPEPFLRMMIYWF